MCSPLCVLLSTKVVSLLVRYEFVDKIVRLVGLELHFLLNGWDSRVLLDPSAHQTDNSDLWLWLRSRVSPSKILAGEPIASPPSPQPLTVSRTRAFVDEPATSTDGNRRYTLCSFAPDLSLRPSLSEWQVIHRSPGESTEQRRARGGQWIPVHFQANAEKGVTGRLCPWEVFPPAG